MFGDDEARLAFTSLLAQAQRRSWDQGLVDDEGERAAARHGQVDPPKRLALLSWCVTPDEWQLLLWPAGSGDICAFVRWLSMRHAQQYHLAQGTSGGGPVFRGRFRSFPVMPGGGYPQSVARFIERHPCRLGLCETPEAWPASSAWDRSHARPDDGGRPTVLPADEWPGGDVLNSEDFDLLVQRPAPTAELTALETCRRRGRPLGSDEWMSNAAQRLNLTHTLRPRGRPRKADAAPRNLEACTLPVAAAPAPPPPPPAGGGPAAHRRGNPRSSVAA